MFICMCCAFGRFVYFWSYTEFSSASDFHNSNCHHICYYFDIWERSKYEKKATINGFRTDIISYFAWAIQKLKLTTYTHINCNKKKQNEEKKQKNYNTSETEKRQNGDPNKKKQKYQNWFLKKINERNETKWKKSSYVKQYHFPLDPSS